MSSRAPVTSTVGSEHHDVARAGEATRFKLTGELRDYIPAPCVRCLGDGLRERGFDVERWANGWPNGLRIGAFLVLVVALGGVRCFVSARHLVDA